MTNDISRNRSIKFNLSQKLFVICLNWYIKSKVSPPAFYFRLHNRRDINIDLIRRYEILQIKINKKKLDIVFWNKCLNLELCPDFLKVKPPKNKFFRSIKDLHKFVVTKARKTTVNELVELKNELYKSRTILNQKLSVLELHKLNSIVFNKEKK